MLLRLHQDDSERESAWKWFVQFYEPFVRDRLARRSRWIGGSLEDRAAEFWSWAYAKSIAARADSEQPFRKFLGGCIKNFALEKWREHRKTIAIASKEALDIEDLSSNQIEEEDYGRWAHFLLHKALEEVRHGNERYARALRLYYGIGELQSERSPGLPAKEVGRILGVSDAGNLVFNARNALEKCLLRAISDTVYSARDRSDEVERLKSYLHRERPGLYDPNC